MPVNDAPRAGGQNVTVKYQTAKAITLSGTDPDGDPLTCQVTATPLSGTLTGGSGSHGVVNILGSVMSLLNRLRQ